MNGRAVAVQQARLRQQPASGIEPGQRLEPARGRPECVEAGGCAVGPVSIARQDEQCVPARHVRQLAVGHQLHAAG